MPARRDMEHEMTKFAIELPATYGVTSRDIGIEVKVGDLSADMIAKLALHGLTQKVGDSAAGALKDAGFEGRKFADLSDDEKAKVREHAKASMVATVDALMKGEWAERRAGGNGLTEVERKRLALFGEWLREDHKAVWAAEFKPLEGAERQDALAAFFLGQEPEVRDHFTELAETAIAEERARKAKLGALSFKLTK